MTTKFFGYGSLVNLATHSYQNPEKSAIKGWRRQWVTSFKREVSFLSVIPDTSSSIQGMIADVSGIGWDALDIRETGYNRIELPEKTLQMYVANPDQITSASQGKPILLSYIDCVIQGFHTHFGKDGVSKFFATTSGWDRPILNDRLNPIYPRAQSLSNMETQLIDQHLNEISATFITS